MFRPFPARDTHVFLANIILQYSMSRVRNSGGNDSFNVLVSLSTTRGIASFFFYSSCHSKPSFKTVDPPASSHLWLWIILATINHQVWPVLPSCHSETTEPLLVEHKHTVTNGQSLTQMKTSTLKHVLWHIFSRYVGHRNARSISSSSSAIIQKPPGL